MNPQNPKISKKGLQKKIKSRYNQAIQHLDLFHAVTDWHLMISHRSWESLKLLKLGNNLINDNQLKLITTLKWPSLTTLNLTHNQITDQGINSLAENEWPSLQTLGLQHNRITGKGLEPFLRGVCKNLSCLQLGSNLILSIKIDVNTKYFANLTQLYLNNDKINSEGIKWLTKVEMKGMRDFNIWGSHIGNEGIAHFTKADWPNFERFWCGYNKIGLDGFENFMKNSNHKKLRALSIEQLTISGIYIMNSFQSSLNEINQYNYSGLTNQSIKIDISTLIKKKLKHLP